MSLRMAGLNAANPPITSNTNSSSCGPGISSAIPSNAATQAGTCLRVAAMMARAVRSSRRVVDATAIAIAVTVSSVHSVAVVAVSVIVIHPLSVMTVYVSRRTRNILAGNGQGWGGVQKLRGPQGPRHASGIFPPDVKKHSLLVVLRGFLAFPTTRGSCRQTGKAAALKMRCL